MLQQIAFPPIRRGRLDTLQVNLGYRCNQSCVHCHVNAGPNRTEEMSSEVIDVVLAFLARKRVATLDITGGAPELNQHFRKLVRAARKMDVQVMDRCNLTVLEVPGQEDLVMDKSGKIRPYGGQLLRERPPERERPRAQDRPRIPAADHLLRTLHRRPRPRPRHRRVSEAGTCLCRRSRARTHRGRTVPEGRRRGVLTMNLPRGWDQH